MIWASAILRRIFFANKTQNTIGAVKKRKFFYGIFKGIGKKDAERTNRAKGSDDSLLLARSCTKVLRVARFVRSIKHRILMQTDF